MNTLTDTTNLQKVYDGTQGKILEMLGNGLSPEIVASALGISASYISQLLQEPEYARQVTEKRFLNLQAATTRDRSYDALEDALLDKMADLLPLMYKPHEVLRAISVINAAKRRGASAPENTVINNTVVQLSLPIHLVTRFIKDANNQVVVTGEQELITINAAKLSQKLTPQIAGTQNDNSTSPTSSLGST